MLGSTNALHALAAGGPVRLVAAGSLGAGVLFARNSTAQMMAADGLTWQEAAANQPRFHGAARRLLVAGERSNALPNPRAEGAAPGTWPTGWSISNASSLSVTCNGPVAAQGMTGIEVAIAGEASAAGNLRINLGTAAVTIPAGGVSAFSIGHQAVSATGMTGAQLRAPGASSAIMSVAPPGATVARVSAQHAYASAASNIALGYVVLFGAGTVNIVLRLYWPQFEPGAAFASSPILPPAGSPAAGTRAADQPSLALAAAQGTLAGTFLLPQAAPAGIDQGLLQLDDGTDGNRVALRNAAGGSTVEAAVVSAGTATILAGGTVTPGTPFRVALAWGGGGVALCLGSGTVRSTATLPSGLSRLLIGHAAATLARPAFGEVGPLDLHPTRLPDATLQALTAP